MDLAQYKTPEMPYESEMSKSFIRYHINTMMREANRAREEEVLKVIRERLEALEYLFNDDPEFKVFVKGRVTILSDFKGDHTEYTAVLDYEEGKPPTPLLVWNDKFKFDVKETNGSLSVQMVMG